MVITMMTLLTMLGNPLARAEELKVGSPAPPFKVKTHEGAEFDLASRKGKWTVLYFYPKADTPGCTKQACTFRDKIKQVRDLGADVYGISADSVEAQNKFHKKFNLNFALLADEKADIVKLYGAKMPVVSMSKRWTFVIDPELKIRAIEKDVNPTQDADYVTKVITDLKSQK
jgi:peroxiredoxin Q/BCP